ncbi:alpha/beta hydrolase [Elusimicrobiota bacterium]
MKYKGILLSLGRIISVVLLFYIFYILILYFNQESFIFFPSGISNERTEQIKRSLSNAEEVSIKISENVSVKGWFVKNGVLDKYPLIIYFGGNAEEVSHFTEKAKYFKNWSFAAINYRGYGQSTGKPGEKELYSDALAIYDYFSKRADIDTQKIVVLGRSLGSGVAVYLAKNRAVGGVMLVSPYGSLISLAKRDFPYIPVSLLLKHRFDSMYNASQISVPMLTLIARDDKIIDPIYSLNLVEKWGGKYNVVLIDGVGHNNITYSATFWNKIDEFLDGLKNEKK